MHWIALQWPAEATDALPTSEALGWWALRFTPRVAWVDEALLLEVSACERLWGGRLALMREIARSNPAPVPVRQAWGATSLIALARLRMFVRGERPPADVPGGLPLDTLSAAREHLSVLAHLGCRQWSEVAALPRGGLTRRFGRALRDALDTAWGVRPESHRWLSLPEVFEQKQELPALAESAPELMWSAARLLGALQIWLRARQCGVLALELRWTLDLKRFNGVDLPPHQEITVRTAEPTQDVGHLRRLLTERLALTKLAAPVSWLRLRSIETTPWSGASASFLPEDNRKGDKLHELVERLSARLGPQQVLSPVAQADHRPECRQLWTPALRRAVPRESHAAASRGAERPPPGRPKAGSASPSGGGEAHGVASRGAEQPPPGRPKAGSASPSGGGEAHGVASRGADTHPAWLLTEPLPLDLLDGRPCYRGVLRKLVGPQRLEAGWWASNSHDPEQGEEGGGPAVRDYYIAESPEAGLVWVFRERPSAFLADAAPRWFLQGIYA